MTAALTDYADDHPSAFAASLHSEGASARAWSKAPLRRLMRVGVPLVRPVHGPASRCCTHLVAHFATAQAHCSSLTLHDPVCPPYQAGRFGDIEIGAQRCAVPGPHHGGGGQPCRVPVPSWDCHRMDFHVKVINVRELLSRWLCIC